MVKIKKSKLPPETVIRSEKDYRSGNVITILQKDFHNKCYLCEMKNATSINVEHLRPCKNNEELKYNWENLFYACGHCNKIKGSQYEHMIDCTKDDPERYIVLKFQSHPKKYVEVLNGPEISENEEIRELLGKIYNGADTAISDIEAMNLKNGIAEEMAKFQEKIDTYFSESDPKLQMVCWNEIRTMLSRESNFAGFKRGMVLQNEELLQCFGELLS